MQKYKYITSIIIVFCFSVNILAGDIDISGSIESELRYINETEEFTDSELLKLVLEKQFGYKANFLLELGLESNHSNNTDTSLNKIYFDYYTENMDWRLGKQEINWGSSYKINPTSYFTQIDSSFLDNAENKEGINAAKATYYMPNNIELTGVVAPFNREGEGTTEDVQFGMKLTKRYFHDFDISFSTFSGDDNFPFIHPLKGILYPKVNKYGVDVIGSISNIGTWAEVVYVTYDQKVYDNIMEGSIGAEYKFGNDINLIGQIYYRENRVINEPNMKMFTVKADGPVGEFHKWDLSTIYDFEGESLIFIPEFKYSLADSIWLNIGCMVKKDLDSAEKSNFSDMIKENVYTKISIDF